MSTISYKGFSIETRAYQLRETKHWTVDIRIRRKGRTRSFSAPERYSTEAEAVAQSLEFGRRIIDGKVPECSVEHLRG